jgi:hypothetical protein
MHPFIVEHAQQRRTLSRVVRRSLLVTAPILVLLASALVAIVIAAPAHAPSARPPAGHINFVKRTDSSFDRYTAEATTATRSWMDEKLWRAVVYAPYFDAKTSWYQRAWLYKDLYGIGVGSDLARRHPEWILRDAAGRRLYIPWGCADGRCPQYAGDVASPSFRRWWIRHAKDEVARGYLGLWIDDVNLELRTGNGDGRVVPPTRRGQTMSPAAWRRAVAGFTTAIRRALPDTEIVHNAIWYAGGEHREADAAVRAQIRAADFVNLERGVNDGGLTGGDGEWSLRRLLGFVDHVHQLGRGVIFEGYDTSPAGREYNLSAYLLVSGGGDGVALNAVTPPTWWEAYDTDLGAARGDRTEWQGLLRRDFAGGLVLVAPPGSAATTVDLPGSFVTTSGRTVQRVTLSGGQGAVLRAAG